MYLGDSEIRFALDLGRDNFKAEPGVTRIGVRRTLSKKQENQLIAIDAFAKKYGLTIIVTPKLYANGQTLREYANGVENGKVIILSLAAEDNALTVAAFHEAFHMLPADVKMPLINDMIRQLIADEGESFRNIFYQRYALYNTTTSEDKASLKETLKELDFDGDVMAQLAELFGEKELADTYEEIAAQYAGTLLSRDDVLSELAEKNPTGFKKFVAEIKKFLTEVRNYIAYLAKHDETAAAALRKDAKEAAELAERITDVLEKAEFGERNSESGVAKYSYAGEGAETADKTMLQQAKEMFENGEDSETIRKETGWFKGYDGKWRFEIDDSKLKLYDKQIKVIFGTKLNELIRHDELFKGYPQLNEAVVFVEDNKYSGANGSADYSSNSITINKRLTENRKAEAEREAIFKTDEYKAYTEKVNKLREAASKEKKPFEEKMLDAMENGDVETAVKYRELYMKASEKYNEQLNKLTDEWASSEKGRRISELNKQSEQGYELSEDGVATLLHEIQHLIQFYESFAIGANPEYWKNKIYNDAYNNKFAAKEKLYSLIKDNSLYKEIVFMYDERVDRIANDDKNIIKQLADAYDRAVKEIDSKDEKVIDAFWDYSFAVENFKTMNYESMAMANYRDTAGEIESRDVSARMNLTAEQRKEKRPDIDRTNVVFAEGNGASYDIGILENGNTYVIATRNIITSNDVAGMRKQITDFFNLILGKNKYIDIPTFDGDVLRITKKETAYKARDNYADVNNKRKKLSDDEFFVKTKAESHIDELVETSRQLSQSADKKNHNFAKNGFSYRVAYFQDFNGDYYKIEISVGNSNGIATVYNVGKIKEDKLPSAKLIAVMRSKPLGNMSSVNSISNSAEKSNSQNEKNSSSHQSLQTSDAEYMDAVERGDMETAQRMVEEAAKKAGYRSQKVYHGSTSAVFTEFNTPMIFFSDSLTTSSAYAGMDRSILMPKKNDLYNLHKQSTDKIIDWLAQYRDLKYKKTGTKAFIQALNGVMNSEYADISGDWNTTETELTDDAAKNTLIGYANDYKKAIANIKNGTATKNDLKAASEAIEKTRDYIENIETFKEAHAMSRYVSRELGFRYNGEYADKIVDFVHGADMFVNQYGRIESEEQFRSTAREQSRYFMDNTGMMRRGNYVAYLKMNKPFVADAKGQGFRGFGVTLPDGTTETFSTDALAKWAQENGYDGVIIKNVYDTGRDDVYETATDYIVFDSSQVKSADPVTYDDNGNVIPLSERFNPEKTDIRYSMQTGVTQAAIDDFNEDNGLSVIDTATESASPARFSLKTWNESDYVVKRREAAEMLAASLGVSKAKATKYLRDIDSVAKMIADDRARLDYESSPGRSAFVSNSEYGGSIDFSTLCKKRRLLTGTFSEIQKLMSDTVLSASDILMLRNMMKEKGYEVSCGLCYVEGSRAQMGKFAAQFIERYKKHNPGKWYPNLAEINTPDGIEWVRINHPEVYE